MSNKEAFMWYAKRRLQEKAFKRRKQINEVGSVQVAGVERCSKYRWRAGQK